MIAEGLMKFESPSSSSARIRATLAITCLVVPGFAIAAAFLGPVYLVPCFLATIAGAVAVRRLARLIRLRESEMEVSLDALANEREELSHARALIEQTGSMARVGGWSLDLATMQPEWSDEVYRIHEVEIGAQPPLEEAIDFYAPEAREIVRAAVADGVANGKPWDLELPFITARGKRRWVRTIGIPEMRDGECTKLWGAFQDITEQHAYQVRVEELAKRLETAAGGAGLGIWEYCVDSGELIWDRNMHEIYGTDPSASTAHYELWSSALHPDDLSSAVSSVEEAIRTGEKFEMCFRIRRPNGQTRHIEACAIVETDSSGATRMVGINRDITEECRIEERLSLAMKAASIGLWDWDVPSGETYFSDTFYTMLDYSPGELPMTLETWKQLCHPDDLGGAIEDIERHLSGSTPAYLNEHRLRKKDGSWLWIRDVGEVVEWDDDGKPKRMIGVHVNIQSLKEMAAREQQANESKSEFLANMSHEIRTPMTAILGFTELLAETASDPESLEAIDTVRRNGEHLLSVINDILDLSKIEAGKMSVESLVVDPVELLTDVASLVRFRAKGKGISLEVRTDGPIPATICTDPTRLRQILINLIGNAIKFTEIGQVEITTRFLPDPLQPALEFVVKDSGIGMSEEQTQRLFQPFSQADGSTTRRFGGSGLGLTISKRLARWLGGDLQLTSTSAGRGTTFTFSVATGLVDDSCLVEHEHVANDHRVPATRGDTALRVSLEGVRLLLVEDGPDNQRLVSHVLRKSGAEVEIQGNGELALAAVEAADERGESFDVILMDMQMPVMDGYTTTRVLRERGYHRPIVALTANAMEGDREKCERAGCDDFATKPIERDQLVATVARHANSLATS